MHFTFWPTLFAEAGGYGAISWEQFLAFVASPRCVETPTEGWSPIRSTGNRRGLASVEAVSALVLDDDSSNLPLERVRALWGGASGVIHTTRRHTLEAPRYRIVLRVTRDMTADEHARVWQALAGFAAANGQTLDQSTKDASRFWYEPVTGPHYTFVELAGAPLDVDAILAMTPAAPASTALAVVPPAPVAPADDDTSCLYKARRNAMAVAFGTMWPAKGKGRHEAQMAFAGALRSEGVSPEEALELLCTACRVAGDEDRPKRIATIAHTYAKPPNSAVTGWTRLRSLIDSATVDAARRLTSRDADFTAATERRFAELAAARDAGDAPADPAPQPSPGETLSVGPWRFKTDSLDAPLPALEYMLDGLICQGDVVMLVAHGGSLKTWAALSMALSVATGKPWLGKYLSIVGPVAVLDWEGSDYEQKRRLKILGAKDADINGRLYRQSYPSGSLLDPEAWVQLASLGLKLLIIDSFSAASSGEDENDARSAAMIQLAGKFANATGCTVVFIHHARKGSGGDEREAVRGSSALFAACDRIFRFVDTEKRDDGIVTSTVVSIKDGAGRSPAAFKVELSDNGLRWIEAEKPVAPEEKEEREATSVAAKNRAIILNTLKGNPTGVQKKTLSDLLEGFRQNKDRLLAKMQLEGLIEESGDSALGKHWVLAPEHK